MNTKIKDKYSLTTFLRGNKVELILIFCFTVIIISVSIFVLKEVEDTIKDQTKDTLENTVLSVNNSFEKWSDEQKELIESLSSDDTFINLCKNCV